MRGYYRCFIRDYENIEKPLTNLLRSEFGKVSASQPKKSKLSYDQDQTNAFNRLKNLIASEEVMLAYSPLARLRNIFNIEIVNAPHSIAMCIKLEKGIENTTDLTLLDTIKYNKIIRSMSGEKPKDIFHPRVGETEAKNKVEKAQD